MLKKIAIVLVVLVAAFLGFVMTRPSSYHAERSAVINAPVDVVFADINTLGDNGFVKWSPWEKKDPAMKKTFTGPPAGVGNSYHWEGNKDIGKGTMTITDSKPNTSVTSSLVFTEPMQDASTVTMSLAKEGAGTKVTWAMEGEGGFQMKLMNTFMSMDKMIGPDFEEGLKNLDKVAQADAKKAADDAAKKAAEAAAATPPPATDPATGPTPPAPAGTPAPAAPAKG